MTVYKCEICNYETDRKHNLTLHNNSKKHLDNASASKECHPDISQCNPTKKLTDSTNDVKNDDVNELEGKYICEYCKEKFKYRQGHSRHVKYRCNIKKKMDEICLTKLMEKNVFPISTELSIKAPIKLQQDPQIHDLGANSVLQNNEKNHDSDPNSVIKNKENSQFECKFCNEKFSQKNNLYRHQKNRCEIAKEIKKENDNNEIKLTLESVKDELKKNNKIMENLTKSSVSAIKFVSTKYPDAPPLEPLSITTLKKMIHFNNEVTLKKHPNHSVNDVILWHYSKKMLDEYIGNMIIKEYKKTNPKEQSFWNTDTSRQSFILVETVKKESSWTMDKKGEKIIEYIIKPILANIRKTLYEYLVLLHEFTTDTSSIESEIEDSEKPKPKPKSDETIESALKKMTTINHIFTDMNNNELEKNLVKYLSPHFHLKKI